MGLIEEIKITKSQTHFYTVKSVHIWTEYKQIVTNYY